MTNLEKFDQLVARVRSGLACSVDSCIGSACPYYDDICDTEYLDDIKRLTTLLVDAGINNARLNFCNEEYTE